MQNVFGLNLERHLRNVHEAVKSYSEKSNDFSGLVEFIQQKFNVVDVEMFKEWVQKEYPGVFNVVSNI